LTGVAKKNIIIIGCGFLRPGNNSGRNGGRENVGYLLFAVPLDGG
jgi:hypothetical protein